MPEAIQQLLQSSAANGNGLGSSDGQSSGALSKIHTPVPLWMYLTSVAVCLALGIGVGLVFTERFMSHKYGLGHSAGVRAKRRREESQPLYEGDFSDDLSGDDSHDDAGVGR